MKEKRPVLIGFVDKKSKFVDIASRDRDSSSSSSSDEYAMEKPIPKKTGRVIKYGPHRYIHKSDSDEIYNYKEYIENKKLILVGRRIGDKIEFIDKSTHRPKFEGKVIKIGNKKYIQRVDSDKIYDYDEYQKNKTKKLIGRRDKNKIILL